MNATTTRRRDDRHVVCIPCSQSQKRFWFESQLHPENPGLNVAVRWRLEGEIVHANLERAWRSIIERHQTLRTYFAVVDGEPHQVVEPEVAFHIPLVDLTTLTESEAFAEADRVATLEARRTFDITAAPLIRVTHVRVRPDVSVLLVTAHHAVCDGWSIGVLAREMGEICAALSAGRAPDLPELTTTYADYTQWERDAQSTVAEQPAGRDDAARKLEGFEPFEILPDKPRPSIQTANGEIISILLDRQLTGALSEFARAKHCTLFMMAYATLLVLLHRYSGETDITLGTQIAGREEVGFEHLVGTFINTVALRTDVSDDPSFDTLLERASDTVSDAFELRHVPLEELVEIVNPKRDLSRNALFSINFVYQRSFITNQTYGDFRLVDMPSRSAGPICDLNFFMVERPEGWRLSCEFNTDLYRSTTVERMLQRLVALLRAVVADPGKPISAFPMMSGAERDMVVGLGAGARTPYERDQSVQGVFAARALAAPAAVAVVDETAQLSYADLERDSNRLAHYLHTKGAGAGSTVGVALERSARLPAVLLGILKAGAAYVPLDPSYPRDRLSFIIEDANVRLILTEGALRDRLPEDRAVVIDLSEAAASVAALSADPPERTGTPDDLAYIMYTSGSSGRPKGVAVNHRAIIRLVRGTDYVELDAADTVLQYASLAFDASTFEIWAPLLNGGRLAIAPRGLLTVADFGRTIERFEVTTLWLTAALFREMFEGGVTTFGRLKRLLVGGDVVSPLHARCFVQKYPDCRLINGYGPTENTTFSCAYPVPSAEAIGESVPIGRPIANSSAYVLDGTLQPVPFGVVGELCVGGDGVAAGYVNLPDLTAERFVHDPFSADPAARLYRTGDLARQRDDGVIEFVGRVDDQVKVRGYRVEPREIEAALSRHPSVADVAVIVGNDSSGDRVIWAYVVLRGAADPDDLRAWLNDRLPAFMLPSAIVTLPALPLSSNGKVDRNALPAPVQVRASGDDGYRTETEARLAGLIHELLGNDRVERDVDVFSLGFHSLLAVRLAARVQETFHTELRLRALFENPTVAAIAAQIDAASDDGTVGGPMAPVVERNAGGSRPPFMFFHGDFFAEGLYAHRLSTALGREQPVYLIAPHGTAGLPLLPSVEGMAGDYAERLRRVQPHGPYRLGGFCASGLIAYEVARILRSQGETVERLVLMNSSPMPSKSIPALDALVRRFGLDPRLKPRLRDRLCYHLARLHAVAVAGPVATFGIAGRLLRSTLTRSKPKPVSQEPQPFEKRRGGRETENSFAHVVAAFTYHPKAYDGTVTVIWSEDQSTLFADPTMGWGAVAKSVEVLPMSGGHVGALDERIEELATIVTGILEE